jgi:hypothetical protein
MGRPLYGAAAPPSPACKPAPCSRLILLLPADRAPLCPVQSPHSYTCDCAACTLALADTPAAAPRTRSPLSTRSHVPGTAPAPAPHPPASIARARSEVLAARGADTADTARVLASAQGATDSLRRISLALDIAFARLSAVSASLQALSAQMPPLPLPPALPVAADATVAVSDVVTPVGARAHARETPRPRSSQAEDATPTVSELLLSRLPPPRNQQAVPYDGRGTPPGPRSPLTDAEAAPYDPPAPRASRAGERPVGTTAMGFGPRHSALVTRPGRDTADALEWQPLLSAGAGASPTRSDNDIAPWDDIPSAPAGGLYPWEDPDPAFAPTRAPSPTLAQRVPAPPSAAELIRRVRDGAGALHGAVRASLGVADGADDGATQRSRIVVARQRAREAARQLQQQHEHGQAAPAPAHAHAHVAQGILRVHGPLRVPVPAPQPRVLPRLMPSASAAPRLAPSAPVPPPAAAGHGRTLSAETDTRMQRILELRARLDGRAEPGARAPPVRAHANGDAPPAPERTPATMQVARDARAAYHRDLAAAERAQAQVQEYARTLVPERRRDGGARWAEEPPVPDRAYRVRRRVGPDGAERVERVPGALAGAQLTRAAPRLVPAPSMGFAPSDSDTDVDEEAARVGALRAQRDFDAAMRRQFEEAMLEPRPERLAGAAGGVATAGARPRPPPRLVRGADGAAAELRPPNGEVEASYLRAWRRAEGMPSLIHPACSEADLFGRIFSAAHRSARI